MKRYPEIDYSYRPASYWEDETPAQAILKNIKGDFTYCLSRKTSKRPLTLRQLVSFFENSSQHEFPGDLITGYNELNNEHLQDRDYLRNFTRISSEFYPQLARHCEHAFDDWVTAGQKQDEEDEDEVVEEEKPS